MEKLRETSSRNHYLLICVMVAMIRFKCITKVKEKKNFIHTIKQSKANWIGNFVHRNCLLKHVIGGKIEGTGR
jgi:hypothetical protein